MAGRVKRTRRAVSCRQGQGKEPAAVGHLAMGSRDQTPSPQGLTKVVAAAVAAAAAARLCQQVTDVDDVDVLVKGASTGSTRKESGAKAFGQWTPMLEVHCRAAGRRGVETQVERNH